MRPGRRITRPRCCIWCCVSRGLTLRYKAAGHSLSSRLELPQGSGMERSLDCAHCVRCAQDDRGDAAFAALGMTGKGCVTGSGPATHGSRRKRGEHMCPEFCPASVPASTSATENCGWGMERAGFHAPLVVENRPFILEAQKPERDLQRCLGRICEPLDASARGRGQARRGGAEGQVKRAKVARNRR